ncbi:MAG: lysozyme inhibitor LprI family protein [Formosimonas sp.]
MRWVGQLTAVAMCALLPTAVFADTATDAAVKHCYKRNSGAMAQTQCLGETIENLEKKMDKAYQKALNVLPEHSEEDARKSRGQLQASQTAWVAYKNANCSLIGGFEGGNNLWVTHFSALCEVEEVLKRTRFLLEIGSNS